MPVERSIFGQLSGGEDVERLLLSSGAVSAAIITYGATLQAFSGPDRSGAVADVTLGHDDLRPYELCPNFFGVTVGRFANRIAGGRFVLDGVRHQLDRNDGPHSLHGGWHGFDRMVWTVLSVNEGPRPTVVLGHTSPDGSGGFPGHLNVRVRYTLNEDGRLDIAFLAATTVPTIVNLTNHAVFNLAGGAAESGIGDHWLTIPAARYTPIGADAIPTGKLRTVAGTPFDFRTARALASGTGAEELRESNGYNHNLVLDKGRGPKPGLAARLEHPASGRVLEVLTTEPGIQLYGSNHLDGSLSGKGGRLYQQGQGVALEPQNFPDAPNHPHFPSARVDPGVPYRHDMAYRLSVAR